MARSRVKYSRGWRGLKVNLEEFPERLQDRAFEITKEVTIFGAERMYEYVDRIDTGHMKDNVTYRVPKTRRNLGRFGWVDHLDDYFIHQDRGFYHVNAGRNVEGMRALYRAFLEARELLAQRLAELERKR